MENHTQGRVVAVHLHIAGVQAHLVQGVQVHLVQGVQAHQAEVPVDQDAEDKSWLY